MDCLTVLDVLDVRDPNVLNVLIDQCHVESVLLIANRSEANRVIVHERPRGAMSAYTLEGDKVLQHGHYSNKDGKLGILRESVEAAVRDERAKLAELREYQGNLARERNEVEAKARVDEGFVRDALAKVSRKSAEKRKLKEAMEELQNAQEEEEPEEDIATYVSLSTDCIVVEPLDVHMGLLWKLASACISRVPILWVPLHDLLYHRTLRLLSWRRR